MITPSLPIPDGEWELVTDSSLRGNMHRAWLGHGWLVESTADDTPCAMTFVPAAPRGPWASPASVVEQLADVAAALQRSAYGHGPMTEEEMAQVKAGRVLPPRSPPILQPKEPEVTSTPGWPHP